MSHQQQQEPILLNKDSDGHNYLKVLLLSNKWTKNKWRAPYKNIGEIPKSVLDSYINLPFITKHDNEFFTKLHNTLEQDGLDDDNRYRTLLNICKDNQSGIIDHVFMDDPSSTELYGQLKILDKEENEYINQNRKPRFKFTSPGLMGTFNVDERGHKEYLIDTMRAFHLARVPIPAFDEEDAEVKAVCMNGNSESCRQGLAFAGLDEVPPTENVNNSCACKNSIDMSSPKTEVDVSIKPANTGNNNEEVKTMPGSQLSTADAIAAAREEANKIINENNKNKDGSEKTEQQKISEKEIQLNNEKKKLQQDLETERDKNLGMYNYFIDKMIVGSIPKESFKKEEEYNQLKDTTKGFVSKYNMSLEDADWFISKVAQSVIVPSSTAETKEDKKKTPQYAGYNNTTYSPDLITRGRTPTPAENVGNPKDDSDWDIV